MTLTKEVIEQRLQETEVRFNAAKIAKDQAEAQLEDKSNECLRIQGEFRALKQLAEQITIVDPLVNVPEEVFDPSVDYGPPKPGVKVKDEPKQEATNGRAK